ncbi:hypothetical protein AUP68_17868 [Ilyonectria robusta]
MLGCHLLGDQTAAHRPAIHAEHARSPVITDSPCATDVGREARMGNVPASGEAARPAEPTRPILISSPPSGPGYLGFTSHSTVFEETRHSLSLLHGPDTEQDSTKGPRGMAREGIRFRDLPSPIRQACLFVLEHLPGQPNEKMIFRDNPCEEKGWSHIAVAKIVHSLQETFCAQRDVGESELERIAEQICQNTVRPFRDIHTSPWEWLEQFCGSNLRWESLGLLWAYLERISDALDSLRTGHLAWMAGKKSTETALACLGYCIDLARYFNEGNDLLLDLCRRKATLESIIVGDASLSCWNFPASLVYDAGNLFDPSLDIEVLYTRILVHLGHLQNLFFVERLLLRNGAADEGNLLLTSFDMVILTLVFWTHKDQFATMRRNFEWLVMAFGAPAGGILCLELLRPSFRGTHPKDPRLSRSAIIQQLSLLIGFLDWVRPPAPNADLCADCKTIIQGVLDHHLNAGTDNGGALQSLDWDFANAPGFNFDLLDTFDWLRADWQ